MGKRCLSYGKEWERDDPLCTDCLDRNPCRTKTLQRRRSHASYEDEEDISLRTYDQGMYSYRTNTKYLLPSKGEHWAMRLLKNVIAAILSALGGEVCAYFQEMRWPHRGEVDLDQDREEPKYKTKPVKKTSNRARYEEDDFEFDLDDL